MLLDVSHRRWMLVTLLLLLVASITYAVYAAAVPDGPTGGSLPGMIYGILGMALMVFAGLLSMRKRVPSWQIGSAQTWLRGHLWLGMLSVPLLLFHSGFHWGGPLEVALWVLLILVIGSGLLGLLAQQFLPRMMTTMVQAETMYEQVRRVCSLLQFDADVAVADVCGPLDVERPDVATEENIKRIKFLIYQSGEQDPSDAAETDGEKPVKKKRTAAAKQPVEGSGPLKEFYLEEVRTYLDGKKDLWKTSLAKQDHSVARFAGMRARLPDALNEPLDKLEDYCGERRQLALQRRLHHWLHGWLFVHVPVSMALLVLSIAHIVSTLFY